MEPGTRTLGRSSDSTHLLLSQRHDRESRGEPGIDGAAFAPKRIVAMKVCFGTLNTLLFKWFTYSRKPPCGRPSARPRYAEMPEIAGNRPNISSERAGRSESCLRRRVRWERIKDGRSPFDRVDDDAPPNTGSSNCCHPGASLDSRKKLGKVTRRPLPGPGV